MGYKNQELRVKQGSGDSGNVIGELFLVTQRFKPLTSVFPDLKLYTSLTTLICDAAVIIRSESKEVMMDLQI